MLEFGRGGWGGFGGGWLEVLNRLFEELVGLVEGYLEVVAKRAVFGG